MSLGARALNAISGLPPVRGVAPALAAKLLGPFARKVMGLSALTAMGQGTFVIAAPLLSRLYTPADFGLFTVYLSIINIGGPIVAWKFDAALYAEKSKDEEARTLGLSLVALGATSVVLALTLWLLRPRLAAGFGDDALALAWMLPAGLLLSGLWSVTSVWAIKRDAVTTLGAARFAQPAAMTALQLIAGVAWPLGGFALIGANLVSYALYAAFVFARTLTAADLAMVRGSLRPTMLAHAQERFHFPLFLVPAAVSALAVSNMPPLLLSAAFGTEIAGYAGVAARLVAVPYMVASLPLAAVFTGAACRTQDPAAVLRLAQKVFLVNLALVSLPTLVFGWLAARYASLVMGEGWDMMGEVIEAFAVLGAGRALGAPFSEVTSIFRTQALRFGVDGGTAALVIGAIVLGDAWGWSALPTIWLMAALGAVSSCLGLAALWWRIRSLEGAAVDPATEAAPPPVKKGDPA